MKITHRHLREVGYCNRGAREFFRRRGWDWAKFLRNGMEEEQVKKTGDAMALKVLQQARKVSRG